MKHLAVLLVLMFSLMTFKSYADFHTAKVQPLQTVAVTKAKPVNLTVKTDDPPQQKSQLIALVLAIVGGVYGLHRFYLGYKKDGIIMLILTLTGIGAMVSFIWALIDTIRIIEGTLKPADGSDYDPDSLI